MTSADRNNDLVSLKNKQMEWVTPKILLMSAGDTEGSNKQIRGGESSPFTGPS